MIDTILFDWDGTLIDTAQPAFDASQKAFHKLGILVDLATYERIYSPNWYRMYEELQLPREKWKDADDLWLQYYRNENPEFMPGAKTALNELAHRNYDLGIVTSGARARVFNELDAFGFTDAFRVVICGEDVVNRKPHPEGLEMAMKQLQKQADVCCYVGDSPDDMEMGKHAGVLTIGIPSRYPSNRNLASASPDLFFDSLEEFLSAFPPKVLA
jgi:HAD superfamily hydrolase (TIGR01509 family)